MIIARQKRKENIAEYLLYMWQVEDLIRANKFDMDSINRTVIAHYDQPEEVKKEIAQWYEELIEMMRSEGVMEKGHIQLNKNVIDFFSFKVILMKWVNSGKDSGKISEALFPIISDFLKKHRSK